MKPVGEVDPCYPSPCGSNTVCRKSGNTAICECVPGYSGRPYERGCNPECTINSDCPRNRACSNYKCVDPCVGGLCGYQSQCSTINHNPICSCPKNMVGDPFKECKIQPNDPIDPCYPNPCSRNGVCRVVNGAASCNYPECVQNEDCITTKACYGQRCQDPCLDACGINALCNVINHNAVCSCPNNYIGSPFTECRIMQDPIPRPECNSDSECSSDKACVNQRCISPCADQRVCGQNSECRVQAHRPVCLCREGYTGNAQFICYESK